MSTGKYFRPGKKFLRPPVDEEEEEEDFDEESSEEEEEEDEKPAAKTSRKSNANLSSDEDEDEEDYDDEEEEDDYRDRKRKGGGDGGGKKKKAKASSFFDEEAEDDEDDDEDEPYGTHHDPHDVVKKHYTEEDIRREQMDEEARAIMLQQDRRRQREAMFSATDDADEIARNIENRHRLQRRPIVDRSRAMARSMAAPVARAMGGGGRGGGGGGAAAAAADVDMGARDHSMSGSMADAPFTAVSQQSLVPSVSDPSLWMVSCSTGKEEELVYQIMNKCISHAKQGKPLGITGAIAAQSKGRIYIESLSEPAVVEAIQGVRGLMQYTMRLVPIQDMTTVMTVVQKKKPVKRNDWVRMTRGHYKGDLALVKSVRDSGLKCIVQCVPRLDLTLADLKPEEARARRKTVRPPQKFFNAQELATMGKRDLRRQRFPGLDIFCDYYEGSYYHDGYLLKEMTVGSMIKPTTEEDPPTLDELQRFRKSQRSRDSQYDDVDSEENAGSKLAASLLEELVELQDKTNMTSKKSAGAGLLIGDTIEVIEGDLVGLRGKVIGLDGTTVKVKPTNNNIDLGGMTEVEFLANQVRKYIAVGFHVKITDGRYANETGQVVAVETIEGETDCTAVVLTDLSNKQITVRTSQLRESAEIARTTDKLAGYELYDLVVLSGGGTNNEVGIIVRVGREDFTVINNHGIVREVRPEELRGKRNTSSNRALAVDVQGNQIRVGDQVSVTEGPHKGKQATIKRMSRTQLFLYSQTRTENAGIFVVRSRSCLLSGSRAKSQSGGDGGVSPFSTPRSQSGAPQGRGKRDDALIGKTVRIQSGKWKGYLGTVSDATATHVQVELHSRLKKVMVVRERVAVAGDKFGSTEDPQRTNPNPANQMAPTTPFMGGATPMHGGATPMHGGATPMHDSGMGGEDVWRPGGSIDQSEDSGDGWGASSSTADQGNLFGSTTETDADNDGWGSSSTSGSTWAPTTKVEDQSGSSSGGLKREPLASASVKQEPMEATTTSARSSGMSSVKQEDDDDGEEPAVWFMERVCVQIKDSGQNAVIREISGKTAVVEMLDDRKTTRTIRASEISMVPPVEHDTVLVTGGAHVGVERELVCKDGADAILKDAQEDFMIVDFVHLAKIISDT